MKFYRGRWPGTGPPKDHSYAYRLLHFDLQLLLPVQHLLQVDLKLLALLLLFLQGAFKDLSLLALKLQGVFVRLLFVGGFGGFGHN